MEKSWNKSRVVFVFVFVLFRFFLNQGLYKPCQVKTKTLPYMERLISMPRFKRTYFSPSEKVGLKSLANILNTEMIEFGGHGFL